MSFGLNKSCCNAMPRYLPHFLTDWPLKTLQTSPPLATPQVLLQFLVIKKNVVHDVAAIPAANRSF